MANQKITVTPTMSEGEPPEAVAIAVTQGPHPIQGAQVLPGEGAAFDLEPGDYQVTATSLVPHGTPADAMIAVPVALVITGA
jgi:hypothetical protein